LDAKWNQFVTDLQLWLKTTLVLGTGYAVAKPAPVGATATVKKVAVNTGKAVAKTAETGAKGYANPQIEKIKDKTNQ